MDVGDGSRAVSLLAEPCDDPLQVLGFAPSLSREAYDLAACAVDALDLCNAGFGVVGVGVGHRLHGDRVIAADGYVADAYAAGRPASEFRKIHCFTCFRPAFARRYRKGNTKKADRSMCCGLPGFILSVIPSRCLRDRDTG